jgi:hypothetical protein
MEARHCRLLDRHNGGQTLQIVGQTQWRPDIADKQLFCTSDFTDGQTLQTTSTLDGQTLGVTARLLRLYQTQGMARHLVDQTYQTLERQTLQNARL